MKKFLLKCFVFFIIVVGILSFVLIFYGGYVDYFYEKFTTPKAKSLILGDSRSMQGIQPSVINSYFTKNEFELPIMNYSFTIAQIAYGPLYSKSIKKKLNNSAKNGLFILTVSPWMLSTRENDNEEDGVFFEDGMPPHNMAFVNCNPNFEYLIRNFNYFHFKSIIRRKSKMHKDGWLEESNLSLDSIQFDEWKKGQIIMYKGFAIKWEKSEFRLKSLQDLIFDLNKYGQIILLRMPIDKKILGIENGFWPNFNSDINKIATKTNTLYLDFNTPDNMYKTYDGNHLDKYAGKIFTKNLCDSIFYYSSIKKPKSLRLQ